MIEPIKENMPMYFIEELMDRGEIKDDT